MGDGGGGRRALSNNAGEMSPISSRKPEERAIGFPLSLWLRFAAVSALFAL